MMASLGADNAPLDLLDAAREAAKKAGHRESQPKGVEHSVWYLGWASEKR